MRGARISRNVLLLGLTSMFTDVSSEMLAAVLPLYFMIQLKITPLQFGLIDGMYQGASALVRVASGAIADAGQRYKSIATIGYALSAICRGGLLLAGSVLPITALLMVDRLGKGIRTAPRDALITLSSDPSRLGAAFGAHRSLDTIGAVFGPVLAFAVLAALPGAYSAVFVVSLAFALVGVAIIALFVENRADEGHASRPGAMAGVRLAMANPRFRALVTAGALLALLTTTDALIFLLIQRGGSVPTTFFPLLFVGTSAVYLLLALPFGRLADRIGRHRLFLGGHLAIIGIYLLLLSRSSHSLVVVVLAITLLGAYYAATDGVLSALAGSVLPREQVTTGLALVTTATALARLGAAAAFGACWSWFGESGALAGFLVGLVAAVFVAAWSLGVARPWAGAGEGR